MREETCRAHGRSPRRASAGHRRAGFPKGEAQALTSLAEVARAEGDLESALELLHESAASRGGRLSLVALGRAGEIGAVSLELGRLGDARSSAQQALSLSRAMHDRKAVVYELGLLAEIARRGWGSSARRHPVGRGGSRERAGARGSLDPRGGRAGACPRARRRGVRRRPGGRSRAVARGRDRARTRRVRDEA